jgi:4-hydroxybenzoate polyprenyltransferase
MTNTQTLPPTVQSTTALCVDLDGTLVLTDTLLEQILSLAKRKPLVLLMALLRLWQGIAVFKRIISSHVLLKPELLPYNEPLLSYLREEGAAGRKLLLVTAADRSVAESVAQYLRIFDTVLASDGSINLKGEAKVRAIRNYLGSTSFEYAGDSCSDLAVWKESSGAVLVNSAAAFRQIIQGYGVGIIREFPRRPNLFHSLLRTIRIHQWSKNLLIFVPLALSHALLKSGRLFSSALAFLAFSLTASAVYIVNDLLDLEADRKHPRKRSRPFAAGTLSISIGIASAVALVVCAMVLTFFLPVQAQLLLAAYVVVTTVYSSYFKQKLFLDVTVLAALYALRIVYGGATANITLSPWTLAFAIFLFTHLAVCKRLTELRRTTAENQALHGRGYLAASLPPLVPFGSKLTELCHTDTEDQALHGRGYLATDLPALVALGSASGYVAVVVLALYLNSPDVLPLYRHPRVLWVLCPTLAYWLGRVLIISNRGQVDDDPIVFAFRDRGSWAVALIVLVAIGFAL